MKLRVSGPEGRHSLGLVAPSRLNILENQRSGGYATGRGCVGPSALHHLAQLQKKSTRGNGLRCCDDV
jgi:hypothetical protein